MKSVLMLYPHKSMVERDPRFRMSHSIMGGLLRASKFWYTERARLVTKKEWRARFGIINDLLDDYRDQGYVVGWAMFSRSDDRTKVDESVAVSRYFGIEPEDYRVPVGITAWEHHAEEKYPDEKNVVAEVKKRVPDLSELVVGGFHSGDCVMKFVEATRRAGITARKDKDLTEDFFYRMLFALHLDFCSRLDPSDEEPRIMKKIVLDGRIGLHLARVEAQFRR